MGRTIKIKEARLSASSSCQDLLVFSLTLFVDDSRG